MIEPDISIRRAAPGTCCPEPSCDYGPKARCEMCGAECKECRLNRSRPTLAGLDVPGIPTGV